MSDLVGNPEDRFSRVEAHIVMTSGLNRDSVYLAQIMVSQIFFSHLSLYRLYPFILKFHKL